MSIKKCNVNALFIASLCGISANVLAAKEDFIAPPMVNIPAGEFIMGTNSGGKAAQPAHRVAVEAFQMAK